MENIDERYFNTNDRKKIFYRFLVPDDPVAFGIIIHGYGEHSGRYEHVMQQLKTRNFATFVPDHRGHGHSARTLGDLESIDKVIEDIHELHLQVLEKYSVDSFFILAHSMGALLGILYALRYQDNINGIVLSAPMIIVPDYISPVARKLSAAISRVLPNLPIQEFDDTVVCRDPEVIEKSQKDPLCYHGRIRVRTGTEMMKGLEYANAHLAEIKVPALILQGSADKTLPLESSALVYDKISSEDKTIKIFEGLYHEIMNEPEKVEVIDFIADWIEKHI